MSFRIWSAPARIRWLCLKQQQVSDVLSYFSWENKCFSLEWMQNKCPNYSASGQDQLKEKFNICALISLWKKLSHSFPKSWRRLGLQTSRFILAMCDIYSEASGLMAVPGPFSSSFFMCSLPIHLGGCFPDTVLLGDQQLVLNTCVSALWSEPQLWDQIESESVIHSVVSDSWQPRGL